MHLFIYFISSSLACIPTSWNSVHTFFLLFKLCVCGAGSGGDSCAYVGARQEGWLLRKALIGMQSVKRRHQAADTESFCQRSALVNIWLISYNIFVDARESMWHLKKQNPFTSSGYANLALYMGNVSNCFFLSIYLGYLLVWICVRFWWGPLLQHKVHILKKKQNTHTLKELQVGGVH